MKKSEALAAAGSRYAPVSTAAGASNLGGNDAFVGKPCEAAPVRAIYGSNDNAPLVMSFFCMGTPSASATDSLVEEMNPEQKPVSDVWYRGHGWPGNFTTTFADGSSAERTYDESWGKKLGPSVQWRCRTCLDGMGESADLVAGDLWETDESGYPIFDDKAGKSVLIARTERGLKAALAAEKAGYIALEQTTPKAVLNAQPSQIHRKQLGIARLAATAAMGLPQTIFSGFRPIQRTRWSTRALHHEFLGTAGRLRARGYDWGNGHLRNALNAVTRHLKLNKVTDHKG